MKDHTEKNIYPIKLNLRIDWSELDMFEHVNNVSFFKYIQAARINYWEKTGIINLRKERNESPILVSCKCDFKRSLTYPGQIIIETSIESIGNSSFVMSHRILSGNDSVAVARDVLVMYNNVKKEKVRFPDSILGTIERIEKKKFQ